MPGDDWQRFAKICAPILRFHVGHPGKKLMFMGCEFAQKTSEMSSGPLTQLALFDQKRHAASRA